MDKKLDTIDQIREEDVEIESGEKRLEGRIFLPPQIADKNPATLFVHGWQGQQDKAFDVARELSGQGDISLTFNWREHGVKDAHPEKYSREDYLNDTLAAYDYLAKVEGVDPSEITVVGTSMGAYMAAILSTKRDVKRLGFRVPANYKDDGFTDPGIRGSDFPDVVAWRSDINDYSETMSLRALHEFKGKVLIVESGSDEIVPHETVQSYLNALADKEMLTHLLMPDVGHSIETQDERNKKIFRDAVRDWRFHKE